MSRCFSYPPPGYSGYNEALIESIKLQREREKTKAERKKEKREKKEKRREKKERREEKKEKSKAKANQSDEKAPKVEKSWADLKEDFFNKRKECEAEQLEKSGLTEEHGQSVVLHNPSYSSDSTQNSNKRKRSSVIDGNSSNHATGKIIRIRLPLQKHKEPVASASKEQLCSTSGKTDLPPQHIQHQNEVAPKARQEVSCFIPLRPTKELECSTSGRNEIPVQDKAQITLSSKINEIRVQDKAQIALSSKINEIPVQEKAQIASSSKSRTSKKMQRLTSLYDDLVRKWIPPALESEPGLDDDQDWLFGNNRLVEKGCRASSSDISSCCGSAAVIPSAQFLPEADIYALPYTLYF